MNKPSRQTFRIVVLVSGGGTNLQNIINRIEDGRLADVEIVDVIASGKCKALERARNHGIEGTVIRRKDFADFDAWDQAMKDRLSESDPDLIVLGGFLSRLGPAVINRFSGRIINIHPSLIPRYCGKGFYGIKPHEAVLAAGDEYTGATVHLVDEIYDNGKILCQKKVPVQQGDTPEILQQRVMKEAEQEILPHVIAELRDTWRSKMSQAKTKTALISVYDKSGIVDFARELENLGFRILSTGGTYRELDKAGIAVDTVESVTGFPECLDGRVKTLHPKIHGGILAKRNDNKHMEQVEELALELIDLVVINLYPFRETMLRHGDDLAACIEQIDIGGPAMLRSAAKNHADVTVLIDPADYDKALEQYRANGDTDATFRRYLAAKVFRTTAAYDSMISAYLYGDAKEDYADEMVLRYEKVSALRYGENPAQKAAFYAPTPILDGSLAAAEQLHGKELSYNNYADTDAALAMVKDFSRPTVVAVKHANPCGIASADTIEEAWDKAYEADSVSIFGGIIAQNRPVTAAEAKKMHEIFLEVVLAPDYDEEALEILTQKKNIRLLKLPTVSEPYRADEKMLKPIYGGLLIQDYDVNPIADEPFEVVTKTQPAEDEIRDYHFAMIVAKHVKSNAIVLVKGEQTVGIGPGQPNRVTAAEIAIKHAGDKAKGSIMGSDAFFPFSDTVEAAAAAGVKGIIQPGGSIRDDDSIKACDENGIAMVFTGKRHFRH